MLAASRVPRKKEFTSQEARNAALESSRLSAKSTYLVVDLVGWDFEANSLFEDAALFLELNTLGPVVEGTGNVDFFRGVFPGEELQ